MVSVPPSNWKSKQVLVNPLSSTKYQFERLPALSVLTTVDVAFVDNNISVDLDLVNGIIKLMRAEPRALTNLRSDSNDEENEEQE